MKTIQTIFLLLFAATCFGQYGWQTDHYYPGFTYEAVLDGNTIAITDTGNAEPLYAGILSRKTFYILYGQGGKVIKTSLQPDGPQTRMITLAKDVVPYFANGFTVKRQKIHYYNGYHSLPIGFSQVPGSVESPCTACPDVAMSDSLDSHGNPSWTATLIGDSLYIKDTGAALPMPASATKINWQYVVYGSNGYVFSTTWKPQGSQERKIKLDADQSVNFKDGFSVERIAFYLKNNSVNYSISSPQQAIGNFPVIVSNPPVPDPCPPADTVYISTQDTVVFNVPVSTYFVDLHVVYPVGNDVVVVPKGNKPDDMHIVNTVLTTSNGIHVQPGNLAPGTYISMMLLEWQGNYFLEHDTFAVF